MNATVKLIEFNVEKPKKAGGTYKVTQLTVKDDTKGDIKTYDVFTNVPFHNLLTQLKSGDKVNLSFINKGGFQVLSNVERAPDVGEAVGTNSGSTPSVSGGGSYGRSNNDAERQLSICRQSSLKTATDLVSAMLASGLYKKTVNPAFIEQEVMRLTKTFEGYTNLKTDLKELEADGSAITGEGGGEYDEPPFPV